MAAFTAFAIASAVGAAVSAKQSHDAGQASKRAGAAEQEAANSQAALDDYNANVALEQASDAMARGKETEARYKDGVNQVLGAQKAGYAGGNIDVTSGSAVDVANDARRLAELDIATIRTNTAREAMGYTVQAHDLSARAAIARKTGKYQAEAGVAAAAQGNLAGFSTALGTTTSLLQAKYGYLWR